MPSVIVLAGPAGADKTTWMQQLASALVQRGRRVMVVTAPPDQAPPPAPEGEAAWLELGAEGYRLRCPSAQAPSLDEILIRHLDGFDLVLSELAPSFAAPTLEWLPAGAAPTLGDNPNRKAVVGLASMPGGPPVFAPDQVGPLAELILALDSEPSCFVARLLVDGRRIYIKDFVQDFVAGAVRGMVGSLKGGDQAGRVELHLYK